MRYTITNEPHETIELVCEDDRYSLVQNARTEFQKVIVLNERERIEIFKAEIQEGILKKLSKRDLMKLYQALQEEILGTVT